ncbi:MULTISPECIES: inosine/xanthosine triphosphatase [Pantoea]|uniref:Inosine/xanthosine triphosphatase n=2 Tax=Pantoea stewartii TaxID=66269 RepID=H3R8C7_PANSE|nr:MULTISPECIES: inosine/xanthosine triphosphatase [Pantoea]ARF48918.1 inosine/xanthosine triphosphatase [Pantoea stewartii subsp. stewartii DC283]EHU02263.1 thiamin metabolism associated protein [Pantoea stewartii subsp. stewartii DC283]KAB0547479.1 non-canonical purine NTP phosphatase [Pantoea stewartii subsp. stewartii]KGD83240.1 inositol monophosphatase [Pantoea stewartii subsp. indologenes]KHE01776.1 inositol monophosphatase [Pantoea stewartii]
MYHVVAATTNPAKIRAIAQAFNDVFGEGSCHTEGVEVESGVAAQPLSNLETRTGARQRVMNARQVRPEADFWVAIEAGIEEESAFAWIVVENHKQRGESRSASFTLPPPVMAGLREGRELGDEMARLTGIENIKHKGGAIGTLTHGLLSRSSVYHQALILALCPFTHPYYA